MRAQQWEVRLDTEFESVIKNCSRLRKNKKEGTWINSNIQRSYIDLHLEGFAHSLEIWLKNELVGGLYGVVIGDVFCGESMFSLKPNASKIALVQLALLMQKLTKDGIIDCQIQNDHLISMGSINIPRKDFLSKLADLRDRPKFWPTHWQCIMA